MYCSALCQREHWDSHKVACQYYSKQYKDWCYLASAKTFPFVNFDLLDFLDPLVDTGPQFKVSTRDDVLRMEFARYYALKDGSMEIQSKFLMAARQHPNQNIIVKMDFHGVPIRISACPAREITSLETVPGYEECLRHVQRKQGYILILCIFPLNGGKHRRYMLAFNTVAPSGMFAHMRHALGTLEKPLN